MTPQGIFFLGMFVGAYIMAAGFVYIVTFPVLPQSRREHLLNFAFCFLCWWMIALALFGEYLDHRWDNRR